jgi:glutamate/tyrosine decarboxylase-like PLP-dependent enzyme
VDGPSPGTRHRLRGEPEHGRAVLGAPQLQQSRHVLRCRGSAVPLADDFRADLGAVANAIDDDTVLLVGSAPDYSHGIIDPIEELGRLALDAGVPLHIDSCVGGFVLPFLERIGRPAATWDFRVPGVASISADIHKHGYGPKGVSVLMTDSDERAALTRFEFSDWPHGSYATETIGGTRSGAVLAGAWATFMALGESGYKRLAAEVMGITDRFQQGIQNIDELRILGSPPTNKFSYTSSELPIGAIADGLERAGYFVARERAPEAIGMHAAVYHRDSVDRYLADLGDAVEQVRAGRPASGGSVAAYN